MPRAYYAPSDARPFSTSAAKRSSVLALGSIAHLQHHFAFITPSAKPHPAAVDTLPRSNDLGDLSEEPPAPPAPPPQKTDLFPPAARSAPPNRRQQRASIAADLEKVCARWGLVDHLKATDPLNVSTIRSSPSPSFSSNDSSSINDPELVLDLISVTTSTIRAVQRYIAVFPSSNSDDTSSSLQLPQQHNSLSVSTSSRVRLHRHFLLQQVSDDSDEQLSQLRKASVDVLTALRDIEYRYRIPNSDSGLETENDNESENQSETQGHLYRSDVTLNQLSAEADIVRRYVTKVDESLFSNQKKKTKNKDKTSIHSEFGVIHGSALGASTSSLCSSNDGENNCAIADDNHNENNEEDEEDYCNSGPAPPWTLKSLPSIYRCHACILAYLPSKLTDRLYTLTTTEEDTSENQNNLAESLRDGELICTAYNRALRQSNRPWGFIPIHAIHSFQEIKHGTVGTTYRRAENLRTFVAALKLRYAISLPTFDARIVARKDEGWQQMLLDVVLAWVDAVSAEVSPRPPSSSSSIYSYPPSPPSLTSSSRKQSL